MKLEVTHMYDMEVGFKAWVIDFVRKDGDTLAVVLYDNGTISTTEISSIKVQI